MRSSPPGGLPPPEVSPTRNSEAHKVVPPFGCGGTERAAQPHGPLFLSHPPEGLLTLPGREGQAVLREGRAFTWATEGSDLSTFPDARIPRPHFSEGTVWGRLA